MLSALAGTLFFALVLHLLPQPPAPGGERALLIAAALAGAVAAAYALMVCYVWEDSKQQHGRTWAWCVVTLLLNLPGFLIYLVHSARRVGDWKRAALPLAYAFESLLVVVLILIPLIYTQAIPRQWLISEIHIPPPPGPPPAPSTAQRPRPTPRPAANLLTAPISIPTSIDVEPSEPPPAVSSQGPWVPGGLPGGPTDSTLLSVIGAPPSSAGLPAPPPTPSSPKQRIIKVSSGVIAAQALYQPRPVYPPLALIARVQGTVVLEAIIGKDGTVQDLKVISGHPLLVHAAIAAVKTWRYQPTLLNSEPVDVLTEVEVNFTLSQ